MTPEQEFANMILDMTPKEFDTWAEKMSIEEIAWVTYTISLANQQLREQMECLIEEDECYIEEELEHGNLFDAQEVLSKFTLQGLK
jgi:hypothetical protein